jgi:Leucine-rich repeat (LRR) protein
MVKFVIDNKGITSLEDVEFPVGVTVISAQNNNLVDLTGCPNTVIDLNVSSNATLVSLSGCPNSLRFLRANDCGITNPVGVNVDLDYLELKNNNLSSLSGLSVCVCLGSVDVSGNAGLSDITGLPLDCLSIFKANNCAITNVVEFPGELGEIELANNNLTDSDLAKLSGLPMLVRLDVSGQNFTDLSVLPASLRYLSCKGNSGGLKGLPSTVIDIEF